DIKADLHLHTTWSEGEFSIEEMARACQKMGYSYLAITDHSAGLGITHGLKEQDIPKYRQEIAKVNKQLKIKNLKLKILSGVEANIMADGSIDLPDKALAKFDFVIGSIHSAFRQDEEKITKRLCRAIENPHIDMIGHPSGRLIERRHSLNINWDQVFALAAKTGTIMEINAQPDRLDLDDSLILLAKKYGVKFIISTDSHYLDQLYHMRYGVSQARRGWAEKNDILNALNYRDFIKYFKESR
ncbi:MAG: PHP domain-containing protein, partial [Patescibacteria group bacterium]|nr:PHP domain-containing protein [Patescibacteria group bacterium]